MAEREQKHRIAVEGDVVKSEGAATKRGQWLGGFVAIAAVVSAAGLAYLGAPWQIPVAFLSVPVLGIVSRLVEGRRSRTE